jgi:branched-chain amino acid transport system permease protein
MASQQIFNILWLTSLYAVFAMGLSIIIGAARIFNVAHAGVLTWGGIAAWFAIEHLHVGLFGGLAVAALVGAIGGVVLELLVFRPLRERGGNELTEMIVSIGALVILTAAARSVTSASFLTFDAHALPSAVVNWGPLHATVAQLGIIGVGLVFVVAASVWLRYTTSGLTLRTVAYSPELAEMLGLNSKLSFMTALALGSAFAGLAGGLLSWTYARSDYQMGDQFLLRGLVIVILGGFGSIPGSFVGALILAASEVATVQFLPNSTRGLMPFVLLIVVLLLRPQGLFAPRTAGLRT